jgi:hypothetical protein
VHDDGVLAAARLNLDSRRSCLGSRHLVSSLLSIYLNDHLAGSTVALELAKRTARSNRGSSYEQTLARMTSEISEDRQALEGIMNRLGVGKDRAKLTVAWCAEKLGRAKLNGRLTGYSPLSRLVELEMLALGVQGKLLLWQALGQSHGDDPRLTGVDLQMLQDRARSQHQELESQRRRAAEETLR